MKKIKYLLGIVLNTAFYLLLRQLWGFEVAVLVGIAFIGVDMDFGLELNKKLNKAT